MANPRKEDAESNPQTPIQTEAPHALAIANRGVKTAEDFAGMMSALMSDVIAGRMSPSVANAACNAGGKLLKVVEMQYKYAGQQGDPQRPPSLILAQG